MSLFENSGAQPLGSGTITAIHCVTDDALASLASGYKRTVASRYRTVISDAIAQEIPPGSLQVSPKIDGQLWFLVLEGSTAFLISPRGRVISGDLPVLKEANAFAARAQGRTVLAGELFMLSKEDRPRCGDIAATLGGGAEAGVARLCFHAFDLAAGGDATTPSPADAYADRLAVIQRLLDGGKRLQAIKTESANTPAEVQTYFDQWVGGGKAEGLVVRSGDGRVFKVKPTLTLDAAVIGYTQRTEAPDQARSLLLALMRTDGRFQAIGAVGNLGTDAQRKALLEQLSGLGCESTYRHASNSGAMYRFVKPEVVVEVRVSDLQALDASNAPIQRMVMAYDSGWKAVRKMAGVGLIHPVLERVRDDKAVNETDVRAAQIEERAYVADLAASSEAVALPESTVLRREAYTKASKGSLAVRKLLVWKTNKEALDPQFPAYVVHWTDYSPGRGDPIKHTTRPAPTEAVATALADALITKNIKRGWKPA